MSSQSTPLWVPSRLSPGVKVLGVAVLVGVFLGATTAPTKAAWGMLYPQPARLGHAPPDQSWLLDVPDRPGARSKGKVAVFAFKGDDNYQQVRGAVVRALRSKGLNVTATLRPVDSAAQYREMSYSLNMAVYIEGDLSGEGARHSARIRLRSGLTGQHIASATFSGPTPKLVGAVGRGLWPRVGGVIMRACSSASRPRRRERAPLHIEAGTPLEPTPTSQSQGT